MTNALVQVRNDVCKEVTREDAWQEPHELYTKLMSCTSGSMSCHCSGHTCMNEGEGGASRRPPDSAAADAARSGVVLCSDPGADAPGYGLCVTFGDASG
jgi:hypothetical protein